jgi:hypothetical protein
MIEIDMKTRRRGPQIRVRIAVQMLANFAGCGRLTYYEGIVGQIFYID